MWVHGLGLHLSPLMPHPHLSPLTSQSSPLTPHSLPLMLHPHLSPLTLQLYPSPLTPHLSFLTLHLSPSPFTSYLSPLTHHLSPLTPHPSLHPMLSRMASLLVCSLPSSHLPHSLYTRLSSALHVCVASFPLFRFLVRCHLFRGKTSFNPLHPLHLLAWSLFTALVHHYRAHAPSFPK